jgi:hypothetical protein
MGGWDAVLNASIGRQQESRDRKQALSDKELYGKIDDLIQKRRALVEKANSLKGTPDYEPAMKSLQEVEQGLRTIYPPQNNPGAIEKFGHLLTDHLGITKTEKGSGPNAGKKEPLAVLLQDKIEAKNKKLGEGDASRAQLDVAAGPLTPEQQAGVGARGKLAEFNASLKAQTDIWDNLHKGASQEEKDTAHSEIGQRLMQTMFELTGKGHWKQVTGKIYDKPVTLNYDSDLNRYTYPTGESVPQEALDTWVPDVKSAVKKRHKLDTNTGQVVDLDTGQRYNEGDPNNPPEVDAMFKGAKDWTAKKNAFMEHLAQIRAASYGKARQMVPLSVLDTANGNAPDYIPYTEMLKYPGRYIPAGEADKALAKENLMQDIMGTSSLTRQAIVSLKTDFPEEMKLKIALAMRADDPHSAIDQLIASGALGSLAPDQQDFLIATRQFAENAMAMRSILGAGQGSEDMRNAIRDTLPTLLSPDKSYAIRQLDAFDKTITRLHRGVPKVLLRTDLGDGTANPAAGGNADHYIYARDLKGKVHKAKPGTALPKGWTLTSGPEK